MSGIVCAVRGGPDSQPTIEHAIALAQKNDMRLYFLYIVNLDFLAYTTSSRTQSISHELRQMGEFILISAQAKAAARGVITDGAIRQGNVNAEIINFCREIKADFIVLGQPRAQKDESIFTAENLRNFSREIEEQTGAKVVLTQSGTNG